jgi:galactoside O-acetyltransferase
LAEIGADVRIFELVRITDPGQVSVGSHVVIDDFVFVQGGEGVKIASYVHLASFSSVTGGGQAQIGECTGVSSGARILTGTDLTDGSGLFGPLIPSALRAVQRSRTKLGRHVLVGANAVVLPGVTVGDGAVIGAGSVVTSDVPPWTINVGVPARVIKDRPREQVLRYARELGLRDC